MNVKGPILLALLACMLAVASPASPIDPKLADFPARRSFSDRVDRLQEIADQLKLTDDQKQKFQAVLHEEAKQIRELRLNKELSREERVARLREIRKEIVDKIKPILTLEQLEKWKELRSEGPRRRKQE